LARALSGERWPGIHLDVDALARSLAKDEAIVAYRRYDRWDRKPKEVQGSNARPTRTPVPSLCAFVLRRSGSSRESDASRGVVAAVDLGPIEPIAGAVRNWREGLGTATGRGVGTEAKPAAGSFAEKGNDLRRLLLDPLAAELAGASRCVIVPDDVVHLVPFDALPRGGDSEELVGDHLRIETRATVTELSVVPDLDAGSGRLVALGDVDFDSVANGSEAVLPGPSVSLAALAGSPSEPEEPEEPEIPGSGGNPRELASILRGGDFGGFAPLPATRSEVEALTESFREHVGRSEEISILRGADATRRRWMELAPRGRWLHVATHGWFAPESIRSWKDEEPLDAHSGLGMRLSGEEQVKGMSPMLLCGLALAGANLPEDDAGRAPGLITAEEIAALDLARCELAVLSACDTNVGERRAGQGVASLQQALQMAGARSVITSLWKVPDEATRELMVDFYHRMWVEKKPKWQALWEAKKKLREAVDRSGRLRYSTRDWAAWVMTGEPD
ncbi:MAG: CHAT domain-containing protein, partial [Planctomycetota bacterium]